MTWTMQHPEAAEAIIKFALILLVAGGIYAVSSWKPTLFGILVTVCIIIGMPIRLTPTHTHASILLLKQGRPI